MPWRIWVSELRQTAKAMVFYFLKEREFTPFELHLMADAVSFQQIPELENRK